MKPGPALLAWKARRAAMSVEDRLRELGDKLVRFGSGSSDGALLVAASFEITRLRSELTRALSLLSEWAPDTFEQHYMTPEQRAEGNKDDRAWYEQLAADSIKSTLKK